VFGCCRVVFNDALRVRDEGGPALVGQMLLYPVTDYHTPGTPSYVENADGYGLTRDTMEWKLS